MKTQTALLIVLAGAALYLFVKRTPQVQFALTDMTGIGPIELGMGDTISALPTGKDLAF